MVSAALPPELEEEAVLSLTVCLDELVERVSISGGQGRTAVVGTALADLAG
jgi:hypothetical protein